MELCPNCPGPRVPHHCGMSKGKSNDQGSRKGSTTMGKGKDQSSGKGSTIMGRPLGKGADQAGPRGIARGKGIGGPNSKREKVIRIFDYEDRRNFSVRGRMLGQGGENFRHICDCTGVRLNLEILVGRSEFRACGKDEEPTHIKVVAHRSEDKFDDAVEMLQDLIKCICVTNDSQGRPNSRGDDAFARSQSRRAPAVSAMVKANAAAERATAVDLKAKAAQVQDELQELVSSLVSNTPDALIQATKRAETLEAEAVEADKKAMDAFRVANERVRSGFPTLLASSSQTKPVSMQARVLRHAAAQELAVVNKSQSTFRKLNRLSEVVGNDVGEISAVVKCLCAKDVGSENIAQLQKQADELHQAQRLAERAEFRAEQILAAGVGNRQTGPPSEGVTIERCTPSQFADLANLWKERGSQRGTIVGAWKIDNPLLTWHFNARREELRKQLMRPPDELQGFHGTHPDNIVSICQNGFDRSKRAGQVYGAGEYFAKSPDVSVGYCRGGEYMLVCRLCLGFPSSSSSNCDGDHIWVPSCSYYVISSPAQVLPLYIIQFGQARGMCAKSEQLLNVLQSESWTTKKAEAILSVPRNRPCMMSRPSASLLWIGLLHPHITDEDLEIDVRQFLQRHAADYVEGLKVQIVKGKFKKAHAILSTPMPRELVHRLNKAPFSERGFERRICVDDGHGSPEQKCPKWIAGYCRGQNLRFTHPCWCAHPQRETKNARYSLEDIDLASAKANDILGKFMKSAPFHDGQPRVVSIKAIINHELARCHEQYRTYLTTKHGEEPTVRELYHGTNNNILDVLYTHGLQPPADVNASDACPVSGKKGLSTTLCGNDCKHCIVKHDWAKCHMFGLGIYLADMAQKSHRYCSQPEGSSGRRKFRMVVCSVLGRAFTVQGHLRQAAAMHDVATVRALQQDDVERMIEPKCRPCEPTAHGTVGLDESAEKSDLLFVQGLGGAYRPGFSVVNSEYVAFHPHQCLPKYEVTYEI